MPNIRPISDLRNSANEISDFCKQTREPVFITRNGTGDMAVLREDGYLYFLARRDGQIKHMGYRIELGEIEVALHSLAGMQAAACLYDAARDRILCVYAGGMEPDALAKDLRKLLPKYMLPNLYERLEALPYNANGKIDRVALKERYLHAEG